MVVLVLAGLTPQAALGSGPAPQTHDRPYRFDTVVKLPSRLPTNPKMIDPTGRRVAIYDGFQRHGLTISRMDPTAEILRTGLDLTFDHFGRIGDVKAFAWDAEGESLWGATQDRVRPNGWALSGLRPAKIGLDGAFQALPEITHQGQTLDALYWIGREGLALAEFGSRGAYYRPERLNLYPALALIDAQAGRVLGHVPLPLTQVGYSAIRGIDAVQMPDGDVRALMATTEGWRLWDAAAGLRSAPMPDSSHYPHFALSPDGRTAAISVSADFGGYCWSGRPAGGCTPVPEGAGVYAELHDVETGRRIWAIERGYAHFQTASPVFSPDGDWIVFRVPASEQEDDLILVRASTGEVAQTLKTVDRQRLSIQFSDDSERLWISSWLETASYIRD